MAEWKCSVPECAGVSKFPQDVQPYCTSCGNTFPEPVPVSEPIGQTFCPGCGEDVSASHDATCTRCGSLIY